VTDALAVPAEPEPGLLGRALAPFFADVTIDPEAAQRLRDAHAQGTVVHVLRSKRVIDPLYILFALRKLGLPEPPWMHDHRASVLPPTAHALGESVAAGRSALLFLRRPITLISRSESYSERHVEALLAAQRKSSKPILLLPETLQWTKRAVGLRRTIIDTIFGDREAPGRLRELLGFFWQYEDSRFHVGAPVNLLSVLEREKKAPDSIIAKKIRWSILHHLSREEALRTGPIHRSAARTRQAVLHDPSVRRFIVSRAEHGEGPAGLEKKADDILKKTAADMRYGWLRVLDVLIDFVWNRIYDGILVDDAGLAKVRSAARRGPVVLVPSHKSHIDYLVLSQVFFKDGMMPPHVAAGENLNFPPVGTIFRRGGAFFLRRSFKGDKLYTTVFAAYVRRLLKEGHAVEFFIEGGRSRTGKLLPPKMGMLSMCVDPVIEGTLADVSFIPVSISYEKIIEAKSYAHELGGGAKKKEDARALLSSTKVLISRYGRVYVDFDDPISLRVFAASRGFDIPNEDEGSSKTLVTQLGHRIVYGINRVTRVTPTSIAALLLLARTRRGMAESDLFERAERWLSFLDALGARKSRSLEGSSLRPALREAISRLAGDKLVDVRSSPDGDSIYRVDDEGRLALDYYKNNILSFFVPHSIVATAILSLVSVGTGSTSEESAITRAREISRVLKLEISFRVDDFEANFRAAVQTLIARRWLETSDAGFSVTVAGRTEILELAGMIAVFFEAYRAVAELVPKELSAGPVQEKKLVQRVLLGARKMMLEGKIQRAEGASQLTVQNAVHLLLELGVITRGDQGTLLLAKEEERVKLIEKLNLWLAPQRAEEL
jgi:glycerol-3-phosphate O-acyltransferase